MTAMAIFVAHNKKNKTHDSIKIRFQKSKKNC